MNAESKTLKVECDLRIEREWRTCLQAESVADKDKIANLQAQIRDLQELAQVNITNNIKYFFVQNDLHIGGFVQIPVY